ncbi:hypothetical protein ZOSMA_1G02280 [Zostera marina]|uniref:Uncharacterized protein n=1 Tax=Zostera marina TaxID=29655 RepID=A0A0K9PMQ8_ZOSMR|nr:hypothetical protein ZOSMA_1G02280 [Zostera marina]
MEMERSKEENQTGKTQEHPQSFNLIDDSNNHKDSLNLTDSRKYDVRSDNNDDEITHISKRFKSEEKFPQRKTLNIVSQVPRKPRSSINKASPEDRPTKTELDSLTSDERSVIEILAEFKSIHGSRVNIKVFDLNSDPNPSVEITISQAQDHKQKDEETERKVVAIPTTSSLESKHLPGKEGCATIVEKAEIIRSALKYCTAKVEPKIELAMSGSLPNPISSSNGNSQITKSQVPPQNCDSGSMTMKKILAHKNQTKYTPLIGSSSGGREYSKNCSTHLRIAHFIQNSKKKQSIFLNSSMKSSDLHNYRLNPEPNRQQIDYHRPQIYVPYFPHHVIPFSQPPIYHSLPFRETREQLQEKQQKMWQAHMSGYWYNSALPLGQHQTVLTINNQGRGRPVNSNIQQSLILSNQVPNTMTIQHLQQNCQNHQRNFNVVDDGSSIYCSCQPR